MKECKCMKCGRAFSMPDNFMGKIVCEDCDPFMNPQTSHNKDYAKCSREILFYAEGGEMDELSLNMILEKHFA